MLYFLRQPGRFVTRDTIDRSVHLGTLRQGGAMHSLLRLMGGLYVPSVAAGAPPGSMPQLGPPSACPAHLLGRLPHARRCSAALPPRAAEKSWPETVRKDFSAQLHRFMANLTEAVHQVGGGGRLPRWAQPPGLAALPGARTACVDRPCESRGLSTKHQAPAHGPQAQGHTILYVPSEDLSDIRAAAADRDLVQRLESTVGVRHARTRPRQLPGGWRHAAAAAAGARPTP